MDWFYEDGLRQAKELDEILDHGGKLKGPLHGVPVALKVWIYTIHTLRLLCKRAHLVINRTSIS